jgi:hypothetical protein
VSWRESIQVRFHLISARKSGRAWPDAGIVRERWWRASGKSSQAQRRVAVEMPELTM